MAAVGHRICHYWAAIYVFAVWIDGLNAAPQQVGLDSVFASSFDAMPQQPQPHLQPQPQQSLPLQQQRTVSQDIVEQKSAAPSENANSNITPIDLNICSDTNYRTADTLPGLRRSTEMRTLQLGQSGVIWPMGNRTIPFNAECILQLSACAACQILISWNAPSADIRSLFASEPQQPSAADRDNRLYCESIWDFRDRPRCIDLRLIETDADQTTLKPYQRISLLNPPPEYRAQFISSSYKLDLNLQFWRGDPERANALRQLFPLKYTIIDNTRIVRGRPSPADLPTNYSDGFISSPRFPKTYPEGVTVNYTLFNEDPEGTVRLVFTDFRLHYMSILKIVDSSGQEIANTQSQYGTSQRPSAIQSSGQSLTIVFTANNYKHEIGFRANYRFVREKTWLDQPSPKSCDKVFEDTGGSITIENLNLDAFTYVDCIWILEKPRYAPIGFDKLYLKLEDFSVNSGGKGIQLDIHVGRASINRRLLTIFGPRSSEQLAREQPQEGFISDSVMQAAADKVATTTMEEDDSDSGFYLRLRGFLGSSTGMDIAFAQFYRWATAICHDVNEFHCDNGRCISNRYQCDLHDHCGDFSDELKCQNRRSEHGSKSRGGIFTGPGGDSDPETSGLPLGGYTTTILLVAGLIGLILVLLMVTIIVARVYRQKLIRRFAASAVLSDGDDGSSNATNRSSIMMSVDDQLGSRAAPSLHQVGNRRLLVLPESEIGVLEAPPTYDDAMKHPTVPPSAAGTLLRSSQQMHSPGTVCANGQGSANAPLAAAAAAPSLAGPSTDNVSASFDNPAFEPGVDGATAANGRRLRRSRRRARSRSGDSTCSSISSSASDSGSCTGSDIETASDNEVGNATERNRNSETTGCETGGTAGLEAASDATSTPAPVAGPEEPSSGLSPVSALNEPPHGVSKPPVPLPRSSRTSRFATPSQGLVEPAATIASERVDNDSSVSSRNGLNDTLV